jgi:hypothetical protein
MFTRLFNMTFKGKSPALIIQNAHLLKYKLPVKGYNYLVRVVLRAIKILNKGLYRRIVAMLYHPTEINVVLKKKA